MASPEWYFSTMAQTIAALAGFIITILIVVHQLEQRQRARRSNELRELLTDIQDKYVKILYYTMSAIEQPYDSDITIQVDNKEESDVVDWNLDEVSKSGTPVGTKMWIYIFQISQILEGISPSENKEEHLLLTKEELSLILGRLDFICQSVIGGKDTLENEIDIRSDGNIKATSDLFRPDSINYPDLGEWFAVQFDEYDERHRLEGKCLVSIDNLFDELKKDMENVDALSSNTYMEDDTTITNYSKPILVLLIFGVLLPILSLLSYPIITVEQSLLFLYEIILLFVASVSAFYIGSQAWEEFH